ncbi:hypothetical protein HYX13_01425 [Candidatus Woesearchaeota archaeon]|nr:hypothetical protein [Candidatus Woesearchaeota archaeon]
MVDVQTSRLKRIQELKAADSTLTSQKALEMIREEEKRGQQREERKEEREEREEEREESSAAQERKFFGAQKALGKNLRGGGGGAFVGGVASGGKTVGAKAVGTFGDYGVIVAILGLFTFFADLTGSPALFVILETVLLFTSVIYIFHWRGIVPITLFWIWYFLMGGAFTTDPQGLLSLFFVFLLIGMVLRGIFSKFVMKEGFLRGGSMEVEGLLPLLFLILDVGAAEYLIAFANTFFSISLDIHGTLLGKILIFTPWWTILGIMAIKKENFFISLLKIGCVIYIISILFAGIAPEAYQSYQSQLPGPTELFQAKKEFREQAGQQINPLTAFLNQLFCSMSDPTNSQECIQKKEEEAAIRQVCEGERGLVPGSSLYKDCEQQERLKKRNPSYQVFGKVDPTIKEPTAAKVVLDVKSFPGYSSDNLEVLAFPAEIEIKNPRRQEIILEASCSFDGKDGAKDVEGIVKERVSGKKFVISDKIFKDRFLCNPKEKLEGKYFLQFNLTLKDLITGSRLQRAFIGDKTEREKERLYKEEISRVIKQSESIAPADLAWLSFDIGHAAKEVMIENKPYRILTLRSKIENKGKGELVKVASYRIGGFSRPVGFSSAESAVDTQEFVSLAELGFTISESGIDEAGLGCAESQKAFVPPAREQRENVIPLPACTLDYPEELKNPEDWIPLQFIGGLQYDYRITAKAEVKIEKPPELNT